MTSVIKFNLTHNIKEDKTLITDEPMSPYVIHYIQNSVYLLLIISLGINSQLYYLLDNGSKINKIYNFYFCPWVKNPHKTHTQTHLKYKFILVFLDTSK